MSQTKKPTINATVRLTPDEWESLERQASVMGIANRTQLLRMIANGEVEARRTVSVEQKELLGESLGIYD